jgi:hypothetical protein
MSTWRPPWSAQGQGRDDATAAHPSKQLGHGQATSQIHGRATRGLAGPPALRDLPADLGWSGGCQLDLPADDAQARVGRALRATPSQSQPNRIDQHHRRGGPSSRQPTLRDQSEANRRGVWRGREEFALLGWGNNADMVVLRRNGRRRAAGAEPMVRAFGETRTCVEDVGCTARLSRYNPARCCAIHQGWDRQEVTRPRRRCP